jgi:hypothetical protein
MDIREQLAHLRNTVDGINARYPPLSNAMPRAVAPGSRGLIEDLVSGQVVFTPFGSHFETERRFAHGHLHGSADMSDLATLPDDLLAALSDGAIPSASPRRWLFLDTETTGLAGGSGTYAFLIGVPASSRRRLPRAPVFHARLQRGSVGAALAGGIHRAVRRPDHV